MGRTIEVSQDQIHNALSRIQTQFEQIVQASNAKKAIEKIAESWVSEMGNRNVGKFCGAVTSVNSAAAEACSQLSNAINKAASQAFAGAGDKGTYSTKTISVSIPDVEVVGHDTSEDGKKWISIDGLEQASNLFGIYKSGVEDYCKNIKEIANELVQNGLKDEGGRIESALNRSVSKIEEKANKVVEKIERKIKNITESSKAGTQARVAAGAQAFEAADGGSLLEAADAVESAESVE